MSILQKIELQAQEPTEFTKEFRQYLKDNKKSMGFAVYIKAIEACDIIEQQVEIALKSLEACTLANIENMKLQAQIDKQAKTIAEN